MRHTDRNRRPSAIKPVIANIPTEMTDLRQWVLWRYVWKEDRGKGEWAKLPMQINGQAAKSNDSSTWSAFKDVINAWDTAKSSFDGIGFVFTPESRIVGVDVDNCVETADGELLLNKYASRVVELCDSYTELSPSGTGLHLIVKADLTEALKDAKTGIEIYNSGRYFTITGALWSDFIPVREASAAVNRIVSALKTQRAATPAAPSPAPIVVTVDERLKRAFAAQNGHSIERLFHGDTSEYSNDQSAADLALASKLAFWSEGDAAKLDQMFRQSRLMRDKWDERHYSDGRTYGEETIRKAMALCKEFYDPQRRQQEGTKPAEPARIIEPQQAAIERLTRRFKFGELYERADAYRKQPFTQGEHPGWDNVAELYRPRKGLFTIVTGIPSHGKSSWLNALCYNLAVRSDWKILFCSFETQPLEQHACDLARIVTGKPSFAGIEGAATDEEFRWAFQAFENQFQFAQVPDDEMTVDGILAYAADAIRDDQIDGFVFDPWSELNPPSRLVGNYTQFVQHGLNQIRRFTREHGIHTWLVAHPAKFMTKGQKNDVPTLYDIADSAHFYNKADYGVVVHRPDASPETHLHVQKVRFYTTGKKGTCALRYSVETGRYEESFYQPRQESNAYAY